MKSNLDLVKECDSFPYDSTPKDIWYLKHEEHTLGYITPAVAQSLQQLRAAAGPAARTFHLDDAQRSVTICGATTEERTRNAALLVDTWRASKAFRVLDGWRDELYPVYGPQRRVLFTIERCASVLLGVVTYGVHMTVFLRVPPGNSDNGGSSSNNDSNSSSSSDRGSDIRIWVPRRSRGKHTFGGMLDNSVAGGTAAGEAPLECLVREAAEEAALPAELVRAHAVACGALTYFYVREARAGGETGLFQPECEYVYDLELGSSSSHGGGTAAAGAAGAADVQPRPNDDEVESFGLYSVDEVRAALGRGEFKPNCASVMIDFFMRHGILTPENEPDYIEIQTRLHRRLEFPMV